MYNVALFITHFSFRNEVIERLREEKETLFISVSGSEENIIKLKQMS